MLPFGADVTLVSEVSLWTLETSSCEEVRRAAWGVRTAAGVRTRSTGTCFMQRGSSVMTRSQQAPLSGLAFLAQ